MFHIESCHCPAFLPDVPVGKGPRYQAGAIVWQRTPVGVQVLLVERSSGKGWGIPKGGIESGESSQVAALREAWEEGEGSLLRGSSRLCRSFDSKAEAPRLSALYAVT